MKLFIYL